jgi:hypothetical protein
MRAIWKITSSEGLNKQAKRGKNCITYKRTYTLKLLLNEVTDGIEALVILGNTFLYACACACMQLSHVLTPSINSSLLLNCCDLNQFFR